MKTKMMIGCFVIVSTSLVVLSMVGTRLAWGQEPYSDILETSIESQADQVQAQADRVKVQANQVQASADRIRARANQLRNSTGPRIYGGSYNDEGTTWGDGGGRGGLDRMSSNRRSQNNTDTKIRRLIGMLQSTKNEEDKSAIRTDISNVLNRYFDADMKAREKNIVDLETRVQKLRAQFDKRQAVKGQIIELQLRVLSNEAEGLGFFSMPDRERYSILQGVFPIRSDYPMPARPTRESKGPSTVYGQGPTENRAITVQPQISPAE